MRRRLVVLAGLGGLVVPWAGRAEDELWQRLAAGGLVLALRHERTEPGVGDPPGFELAVCATQRNLSQAGRAGAREVGEVLWAGRRNADARNPPSAQHRRVRRAFRGGALAEGVGFEPTDGCPSPVFKTGAFDRSATLPPTTDRRRRPGRGS